MSNTTKFTMAYIFGIIAFALFIGNGEYNRCNASADSDPVNYCYKAYFDVTNNTGGDLNNYPIRVLTNSVGLTSSGIVDPRFWDFYPYENGIGNDIPYTAQNIDSSLAPFWYVVDNIPDGETKRFNILSGNKYQRSDNALYFNGNAQLIIPDADDISFAGISDFGVFACLDVYDFTPRDEVIFEKWDGVNDGYYFGFADNSGTLAFTYTLGDGSTTQTYTYRDAEALITAGTNCVGIGASDTYNYIAYFDYRTNIHDLEFTIISTFTTTGFNNNSENLNVGYSDEGVDSLSGASVSYIGGFELDTSLTASVPLWEYSFDADDITELSSVNPTYSSTIESAHGTSDGTYTITIDQSNISYEYGSFVINDLNPFPVLDETLNDVTEIIGLPENNYTSENSSVLYNLVISRFEEAATNGNINAQGFVAGFLTTIGICLGAIFWKFTKFMPGGIVILGTFPTIGVIAGWLDEWWLSLWALGIILMWLATIRGKQESIGGS